MIRHWLATLSSNETIFFFIAACVVTLGFFYSVFYYLKRARLIEDTPTSRIRSAAQGYVELVGAVSTSEAGELIAPLSGIPCVWFDYKVQRYSSGKRGHWRTINQGVSEQCFQIDDKTGVCSIDPRGANVITEHSRIWYGDTEYPARTQSTKHNGKGLFGVLHKNRYRYIEKFIYIHDIIYALGNYQSMGGGRHVPNTHEMTGVVIREWKQNYDEMLKQYDQDSNGEIDLQEWEEVRNAAAKEAEKRRVNTAQIPTTHVLCKASNNRQYPFILSTRSQKDIAKRFRYYAIGALLVGVLCSYFILRLIINQVD